jgi:hypothetical protein
MRQFLRLNRVAYCILRRLHPGVLTLLAQKTRTAGKISDAMRRRPLLLRVRLTEFALCLSHCASDADLRLS